MSSESLLMGISATYGRVLPSVTVAMFLDNFSDYQILSKPPTLERRFSWFATLSKNDIIASILPISDTIFISHPKAARPLLEEQPAAFVVILCAEDATPQWLESYSNRIVVMRQQETLSYFTVMVQQFFIQQLIWESQMDRVVYKKGGLDDILNVGGSLLDNFITITDKDMNLLSYSHRRQPPDAFLQRMIEIGCAPHEIAAIQKRLVDRKGITLIEEVPGTPYKKLYAPIFVRDSYFGSVLMTCDVRPFSQGLKDQFGIFLKRLILICENFWEKQMQVDSPHYFFFTKLLKSGGGGVAASYVYNQMRLTDIPDNPQLKLLLLELGDVDWLERLPQIAKSIARINHGECYYFPYKRDILVLCYAEPGDSQLSHRKSENDLQRLIYEPFGINCGVSQIFEDITDIDMAYMQTKVTLGLKNTIQSEWLIAGEEHDKGIFLFEDALAYYLVSETELNRRFLQFSFSHTLLQKIYREDQEIGTNNVALFWFYLRYERNATLVAQRLYVHRNTVLYHINKLQDRFDFDLSLQSAREKMLLDFKFFFLTSGHESVKQIFAEATKAPEE
ncbi:MAG: helix-turn-helix domain-containing protein [Coriobacteriales bacterium]|jgi:hypothetical protein|nr:helix-turn-helix domain-containing protein [Coriobacteriales bacterium]